jgi:hypothetical protein
MNDEAHEATPNHELERQIMSYNEAKNEREWWAMHEIERLREALHEMLSVAEVDQLENLSICDVGSERAKMKNRAVASRCGMLLGKLRKIARAALGEGKE